MNYLVDWLGKADDLSIEYDAGVLRTQMLPEGITLGDNLPAIVYNTSDNVRDVEEV